MLGVIQGFTVIGVIVGVGVVLGKTKWLGPSGASVLTKLAFWVATPALLFSLLAGTDLAAIFSTSFLVTAIAMVAVGVLYGAIAAIARWGVGPGTVGAMTASYVNAGNLGIPIAVYVLGDASLVIPVMLGQLLIMAPVYLAILDIGVRSNGHVKLPWWRLALRPLGNPIVIGSLLGLIVAGFQIPVPEFVLEPIALIGNIAVPAVLLAFGMKLLENVVPIRGPEKWQVLTATAIKMVVHPVLAWALAVVVFGLEGHALLAVVVMAALPTAQNIFAYASEYGTGERLAQEVILITTLLSVPAIVVVTLLLHP